MPYEQFSVIDCDGHIVESVAEREDLTVQERQAILADNARRFFRL